MQGDKEGPQMASAIFPSCLSKSASTDLFLLPLTALVWMALPPTHISYHNILHLCSAQTVSTDANDVIQPSC